MSLAVGLLLAAIIARVLGPNGQGKYSLSILLPMVILTLFNLGVPSANVYFLGRGDVSVSVAMKTARRLWVILGIAGTALGAVLVHFFADALLPGVDRNLLWLMLAVFPIALLQAFFVSILHGVQDFTRYNLALFLLPVLTLAATSIAFFAFGWRLAGALGTYILAYAASALFAWFLLRSHLRDEARMDHDKTTDGYASRCIGYGWKAQIANNLAFLNYRADTFLINLLMSPTATGLYMIAVAIAERIWMLSRAVSSVMLPRLSELHDNEELRRRLTPLATKLVFLVSAAIAALLFILARPLVISIFGDEFAGSIGALRWLLPGIVVGAVARGISVDLAARGRVDLNLYNALFIVAFNIVANVLLIPRFGINGAAMATSLAYTLNLVAKVVMYSRISGNKWYEVITLNGNDIALLRIKIESFKKSGKLAD